MANILQRKSQAVPVSAVGFRIVAHIGNHSHGSDACCLGSLFGGIDFTVFTYYLANILGSRLG